MLSSEKLRRVKKKLTISSRNRFYHKSFQIQALDSLPDRMEQIYTPQLHLDRILPTFIQTRCSHCGRARIVRSLWFIVILIANSCHFHSAAWLVAPNLALVGGNWIFRTTVQTSLGNRARGQIWTKVSFESAVVDDVWSIWLSAIEWVSGRVGIYVHLRWDQMWLIWLEPEF